MRKLRSMYLFVPLAGAIMMALMSGCSSAPKDSQIAAQVKSQIAADSALQGQPISVAANHGVVTLTGTVSGPGSKELASNAAAKVKGVRMVMNNLSMGAAGQGSASGQDGQSSGNSGDAMSNGQPIQSYSDTAPPSSSQGGTPQSFVIPAGTRIRVQLAQTLSTRHSRAGDVFSGTVASPVRLNRQTIIPSGSRASGTVIRSKAQGHFAGRAVLAVRLDSVRVGGRSYPVQTSRVERIEKGKGKRSVLLTGGGAGLGALIGGLAGGGEGALVGGLVGGGGGAAGSAFTGNHDLVLPAESVLTFDLQHSVTVR
ncbi:MAG: BON domain-containing protein [Acidobacteriaceae bacterium]